MRQPVKEALFLFEDAFERLAQFREQEPGVLG